MYFCYCVSEVYNTAPKRCIHAAYTGQIQIDFTDYTERLRERDVKKIWAV
jgi:hypothetical protein